MPLLEGYIAVWKSYPKNEIKIRVARPSVLSPSKKLLREVKAAEKEFIEGSGIERLKLTKLEARQAAFDAVEYEKRFRKEITDNPKAMRKLRIIKELAKTKNVRLMCYEKEPPCHRFILIDMINNLEE